MHTILTFKEKKDFNKVITNNDIYLYKYLQQKVKKVTINNKWQTIQYAQYTNYLQDTNSWWLDEILTSLWSQGNFALFCIIFSKYICEVIFVWCFSVHDQALGFKILCKTLGFVLWWLLAWILGLSWHWISFSAFPLQTCKMFQMNKMWLNIYIKVTWQTLFCHWLLWMSSTGTESVSLQPQCSQQCLGLCQFSNLHMHVEIMKSVKIGVAKIDLLSDSCHIM